MLILLSISPAGADCAICRTREVYPSRTTPLRPAGGSDNPDGRSLRMMLQRWVKALAVVAVFAACGSSYGFGLRKKGGAGCDSPCGGAYEAPAYGCGGCGTAPDCGVAAPQYTTV